MADLKYKPVSHDHEAFLKRASKRKEFRAASEDLEEEYRLTTAGVGQVNFLLLLISPEKMGLILALKAHFLNQNCPPNEHRRMVARLSS